MKRSGRTILIVLLGLTVYTFFLGWYDKPPVSQADLQELDISQTPEALRPAINTLILEQYRNDVYLITPNHATGIISWPDAILKDPVVKLRLGQKMAEAFPRGSYDVIRFPNTLELVSALSQREPGIPDNIQGVLLKGDQRRINLKLVISLIIGLAVLTTVQRLDRPSK